MHRSILATASMAVLMLLAAPVFAQEGVVHVDMDEEVVAELAERDAVVPGALARELSEAVRVTWEDEEPVSLILFLAPARDGEAAADPLVSEPVDVHAQPDSADAFLGDRERSESKSEEESDVAISLGEMLGPDRLAEYLGAFAEEMEVEGYEVTGVRAGAPGLSLGGGDPIFDKASPDLDLPARLFDSLNLDEQALSLVLVPLPADDDRREEVLTTPVMITVGNERFR